MFGLGRDPMVELRPALGLTMPLGLDRPEGLDRELGLLMLGLTGSALLPAGKVALVLGLGGFSLLTPGTWGCAVGVARGVFSCGIVLVLLGSVELGLVTGVSLLLVVLEGGLLATRNPVFLGVNFKLLDAEVRIGFFSDGVADDERVLLLVTGVADTGFLLLGFNTLLGVFFTSFTFLVTEPGGFKFSLGLDTEFSLGLESKGFLTSVLILGLGGSMFSFVEDVSILLAGVGASFTISSSCSTASLSSI